MTKLDYYRLKSDLLALQIEQLKFVNAITARHGALLKAVGLDPAKSYKFDDEAHTLVLQEQAK